ncbi:MAG: redox-regulated ATPase YchF [Pirellulaceae bacterium]|nr:redox-regulated ATPase YchF [Pirellulaceae bacterium]
MEAGIVGLPNVGKSTLFNALTLSKAAESANYPFCTIEPNEGIVVIPDPRLQQICQYIPPEKVVPTVMKLVDIAGIVKGASEGQGLGNKFLSHIRQVDAIMQVVRCFEDDDVIHVEGRVDPVADIFVIETELMFADAESIAAAVPRAQKAARAGDKEAKERLAVLEKCQQFIETKERPLRECDLSENELKSVSSFGLLTLKPVLYVANVSEHDLTGQHPFVQMVREHARAANSPVVAVCAKIEAEIAELELADREEMLAAVGLEEPALAVLARAAYKTLGLQSYFTAGEKEVRAWTVAVGATAPQAAGVIHTDFERGFIRAEVYSVSDLMELKSEKAIKEAGRMRVEGKNYVMQDGDVCHFLTNS